ncbi:hypothetical protein SBA4_290018 [Candidatus Sulfopaludibacter sp. SbA4]|nr:hypothetical protein SBA4_290018 [Candidatus Sulfopaludibacter sp. SbA4]
MSKVVPLQVLFFASIAVGQQKSDSQVKLLTVCEVLGGVNRFADSAVAVVGRKERSVSVIDHYEFLSQDRCDHPVITHGHRWSNKIQIWVDWEEGMPKPPSDSPTLQGAVLAAKLSVVRKTTRLGSHQEPRFKADGHPSTASGAVPNEWAVVYGRIVRSPRLDENCGVAGCGRDDAPLIIIAEPSEVHKLGDNGKPLPKDE